MSAPLKILIALALTHVVVCENPITLSGTLYDFSSGISGKYYFIFKGPSITQLDAVVGKMDFTTNSDKGSKMIELCFLSMDVFYLPIQYPSEYTPHIEKLKVDKTNLKEISHNNLKMFPNLEHLEITNNEIEVIERNLFSSNNKLKILNLANNQIWFIHADALKNLNRLEKLYLNKNKCVNQFWNKTLPQTKKDFLLTVEKECSKSNVWTKLEIANQKNGELQEKNKNLNDDLEAKNLEINELNTKYSELKSSVENLEREKASSQTVDQLEEKFNRTINEKTIERDYKLSLLTKSLESLKKSNEYEITKIQANLTHINDTLRELNTKMEMPISTTPTTPNIIEDSSAHPLQDESHQSIIIFQAIVILIFIMLLIIVCIVLYMNRSNIVVMRSSYKLPADSELAHLSSTTLEVNLSNENLSEQKVIKPVEKKMPMKAPLAPLTSAKPLIPPLNPVKPMTPINLRKTGGIPKNPPPLIPSSPTTFEGEVVFHSKGPTVPPRHSVFELKKKLKEPTESHLVDYDNIWDAETNDPDYINFDKKKDDKQEKDIYAQVTPKKRRN